MTSLTMKVRSKFEEVSDDNAEETLDLNIDKVVSLVVPKMTVQSLRRRKTVMVNVHN